MTENARRRSSTDDVYMRLRADIFAARLEPGRRLKFPEVCEAYGTSVGVAREALTRLANERMVDFTPRIGYSVISVSADELIDLTTARVHLESLVFQLSVEFGGVDWESEVVAAHHHLSRLKHPGPGTSDTDTQAWSEAHENFHRALFNGCPSRRLRESAAALRDEGELYRRWAGPLGSENSRDVPAEHEAICAAALERNVTGAAALLRDHISHTAQALLSGIESFAVPGGNPRS